MFCKGTVSPKKTREKAAAHILRTTCSGLELVPAAILHPMTLDHDSKSTIAMFERRYIFQTIIFGIYVSFQGCMMSLWLKNLGRVEKKHNAPPLEFMEKKTWFVRAIHPTTSEIDGSEIRDSPVDGW